LARLDILLVPLESPNPFCDAKSPLKWFESALAGTPSICVGNPVYNSIIKHGEDGLLCCTSEEWYQALMRLSQSTVERKAMADNATMVVKEKFSSSECIRTLLSSSPLKQKSLSKG